MCVSIMKLKLFLFFLMTQDDESDPVVREIPVFLSSALSDYLYLVQHPLYSTNRREDPTAKRVPGQPPLPAKARIRPKHGITYFQILIPIPN